MTEQKNDLKEKKKEAIAKNLRFHIDMWKIINSETLNGLAKKMNKLEFGEDSENYGRYTKSKISQWISTAEPHIPSDKTRCYLCEVLEITWDQLDPTYEAEYLYIGGVPFRIEDYKKKGVVEYQDPSVPYNLKTNEADIREYVGVLRNYSNDIELNNNFLKYVEAVPQFADLFPYQLMDAQERMDSTAFESVYQIQLNDVNYYLDPIELDLLKELQDDTSAFVQGKLIDYQRKAFESYRNQLVEMFVKLGMTEKEILNQMGTPYFTISSKRFDVEAVNEGIMKDVCNAFIKAYKQKKIDNPDFKLKLNENLNKKFDYESMQKKKAKVPTKFLLNKSVGSGTFEVVDPEKEAAEPMLSRIFKNWYQPKIATLLIDIGKEIDEEGFMNNTTKENGKGE